MVKKKKKKKTESIEQRLFFFNCLYCCCLSFMYSEDRFGEIERINFSQPQRDSHFNVPLDKVKPWYKAMDKFTKAIMSKDYCVTYKMEEGT